MKKTQRDWRSAGRAALKSSSKTARSRPGQTSTAAAASSTSRTADPAKTLRKAAAKPPKESYFERVVAKRIVEEEFGGQWVKVYPFKRGFPDRLAIVLGPRDWVLSVKYVHVETKRRGGKLSPAQKQCQTELRALGCDVYTIEMADVLRDVLNRLTQPSD